MNFIFLLWKTTSHIFVYNSNILWIYKMKSIVSIGIQMWVYTIQSITYKEKPTGKCVASSDTVLFVYFRLNVFIYSLLYEINIFLIFIKPFNNRAFKSKVPIGLSTFKSIDYEMTTFVHSLFHLDTSK